MVVDFGWFKILKYFANQHHFQVNISHLVILDKETTYLSKRSNDYTYNM